MNARREEPQVLDLTFGDRAPAIVGATASGRFYSLDAQAGRPSLIACLGAEPNLDLIDRLLRQTGALEQNGVDLVLLAEQNGALAATAAVLAGAADGIIYAADAGGLESLSIGGRPALLAIDRGGRVVHLSALPQDGDLTALCDRLEPHFRSEAPRCCMTSAPALILPNVLAPKTCHALIEHFESSPHQQGMMASISNGDAVAKLDESKKRRRDIELTPDAPLHAEIVAALARRIAPEIKRAFQAQITVADRILIARYDDDGGWFKRHRDDTAPQTAFREFAVSLNLNTDAYEGGELLFPEFDDHRYSPPAGGAIVFSASLLHEAAPVTKGRRYVLLTFLCTAAAQARLSQAA